MPLCHPPAAGAIEGCKVRSPLEPRDTPRDDRQLSQAELRAYDISQGAGGVKAVGYVTVSARTVEDLELAKRRMRTAGARAWLTLEWCDKEHDRAFANTLPLARGLR